MNGITCNPIEPWSDSILVKKKFTLLQNGSLPEISTHRCSDSPRVTVAATVTVTAAVTVLVSAAFTATAMDTQIYSDKK